MPFFLGAEATLGYGSHFRLHPSLGWLLLLPVFAAVILGGIGSPYGAMAGGLVLGVAMQLAVLWEPAYKFAVAFVVLIGVLVVRPQGLLGARR